jgi:dipeptidyl aminopeptidase/acylaminoacyl peptidase
MKREDSVRDIGALLDWVAEQPELDSDRVLVYGGSYGGYMVLASLVHYSDRLAGGVNIVGISNFVTFLENTNGYRRDLRRAEYGDERDPEMYAFLQEISPANQADRITAPLFIIQGANDPRVPASEAEQILSAVREAGGDPWYLLAMDEGHGFRKKSNRDFQRAAETLFFTDVLELD